MTQSRSALDLVGLASLGGFVFSIPTVLMNAHLESARVVQVLAALAFLTNLAHIRPFQIHRAVLYLAAIYIYFGMTVAVGADTAVRETFTGIAKFAVMFAVLGLVVRQRAQVLVVLGALAVSAIYVAYASRGDVTDTRQGVQQALSSGRDVASFRSAGTLGNANLLAMFAVDAIVATITVLFCVRNRIVRVLSVVAALGAAYLALYSGSRKAVIGIGILMAFVFLLGLRMRKFSGRSFILTMLVMGGLGVIWVVKNPYLERFSTKEASFEERAGLMREALEVCREEPIFGLGYGGFAQRNSVGYYTHSTPLEVLCNGGIICLGLYLMLWWALLSGMFKCLAAEKDSKEIVLLYGIACLLTIEAINSATSVTLGETRWLFLIICLGGYLRNKEIQLQLAGTFCRHASLPNGAGDARFTGGLLSCVGRPRVVLVRNTLSGHEKRRPLVVLRRNSPLGRRRARAVLRPITRPGRG